MKADRLAEQKSTRYERRKETAVRKGRKSPPDKSRQSDEVDDGRTTIVNFEQREDKHKRSQSPAYPAVRGFGGRSSHNQSKTGDDRDGAFQSCDSKPDRDGELGGAPKTPSHARIIFKAHFKHLLRNPY